MAKIIAAQPASWSAVEWWICPSYYSEDVLLERVFGQFEPEFLETLAQYLPPNIPCFWTGPSVVSKSITLAHARRVAKKIQRPLLLWDNYPVNDLLHARRVTYRPTHRPRSALAGCSLQLSQQSVAAGRVEFYPVGNML